MSDLRNLKLRFIKSKSKIKKRMKLMEKKSKKFMSGLTRNRIRWSVMRMRVVLVDVNDWKILIRKGKLYNLLRMSEHITRQKGTTD
jgi:hypothetical protein